MIFPPRWGIFIPFFTYLSVFCFSSLNIFIIQFFEHINLLLSIKSDIRLLSYAVSVACPLPIPRSDVLCAVCMFSAIFKVAWIPHFFVFETICSLQVIRTTTRGPTWALLEHRLASQVSFWSRIWLKNI